MSFKFKTIQSSSLFLSLSSCQKTLADHANANANGHPFPQPYSQPPQNGVYPQYQAYPQQYGTQPPPDPLAALPEEQKVYLFFAIATVIINQYRL